MFLAELYQCRSHQLFFFCEKNILFIFITFIPQNTPNQIPFPDKILVVSNPYNLESICLQIVIGHWTLSSACIGPRSHLHPGCTVMGKCLWIFWRPLVEFLPAPLSCHRPVNEIWSPLFSFTSVFVRWKIWRRRRRSLSFSCFLRFVTVNRSI